jgi:hypothetical protein
MFRETQPLHNYQIQRLLEEMMKDFKERVRMQESEKESNGKKENLTN